MGQLIYPDYFAIYAYNAINECAILGSKDGLIWEELQRWVGGCTPYNDGTTGTASGSYQTRYLLGSGNDSKA